MAYKLTVADPQTGNTFQVKYENLAKGNKPEVVAKNANGDVVKERSTYQGAILPPGSTQRQWTDEQGNVYQKSDLKFFYQDQEVQENSQTKVFTIEGYQPLRNYTDSYVLSKYYELYPSTNDMKKDFDRERARIVNLAGMKKLWDYLTSTQQVARGEMIVSSKGFVASDAYLRPVAFGNKWTLELGIFAEEKMFNYLNEEVPAVPAAHPVRKLKMV